MAYPKRDLVIVPECNDENENPCCWAMLVAKTETKSHFIWICKYDNDQYVIENSDGYPLLGNRIFKTLWGAKRMAEEIAYRQDESGYFSD